jgi:ubiquitin-activating enzyme E1
LNEGKEEPVALALEELDEAVIRNAAFYAVVDLQPLDAFFGGVVAQEIVKVTGKFTPINQVLYIDCFEVIPDNKPTDNEPLNSRYDHLILLFGKTFVESCKILKLSLLGVVWVANS